MLPRAHSLAANVLNMLPSNALTTRKAHATGHSHTRQTATQAASPSQSQLRAAEQQLRRQMTLPHATEARRGK